MGGAIAIHYTDRCAEEAISSRIVGLIVIDVVEGTAKEALSQMQQVLRSRPGGFKSVDYAIEWYVRSGQVKNVEAAKISMPGQIKSVESGICATDLEHAVATEESPIQGSFSFSICVENLYFIFSCRSFITFTTIILWSTSSFGD